MENCACVKHNIQPYQTCHRQTALQLQKFYNKFLPFFQSVEDCGRDNDAPDDDHAQGDVAEDENSGGGANDEYD